jgi:hypothetical protein
VQQRIYTIIKHGACCIALCVAADARAERLTFDAASMTTTEGITGGIDFLPQLKVGGVVLGSSPEQAERAAVQNGFTNLNRRWLAGYSYQQILSDALHKRDPKRYPPSKVSEKDSAVVSLLIGPSGEKLYIYYANLPDRQIVRSVRLTFDPQQIDAKKFKQAALAQYGKPSAQIALSNIMFWCAPTVQKRLCGFPIFRDNGYLGLKDYELILDISSQIQKRIDQSINAKVEATVSNARRM